MTSTDARETQFATYVGDPIPAHRNEFNAFDATTNAAALLQGPVDLTAFYASEDTTDAERAMVFAVVLGERNAFATTSVHGQPGDVSPMEADRVPHVYYAEQMAYAEAAHKAIMASLSASLDRANTLARDGITRLQRARDEHAADITLIGETLMEEAERRQWCSEYDQVVEQLNRRLNIELERRITSYDVTYTVRITVEARDEDDARSMAESEMSHAMRTVDMSCDYDLDEINESD